VCVRRGGGASIDEWLKVVDFKPLAPTAVGSNPDRKFGKKLVLSLSSEVKTEIRIYIGDDIISTSTYFFLEGPRRAVKRKK
jgi:hypothetical protein